MSGMSLEKTDILQEKLLNPSWYMYIDELHGEQDLKKQTLYLMFASI